MLIVACTTFLSAFLLFLVQPLIGRQILPWFGGSASVWSACMLFFQVALLAGYGYAHWLSKRLSARRQVLVHGGLLGISLASLPITVNPVWKQLVQEPPGLSVFVVLVFAVGLPYLVLSTTGPLMQAWFARMHASTQSSPRTWRLYALSNLASMLALLAYPVAVEPTLRLSVQARLWSVLYVVFVVLCLLTAWQVWRRVAGSGPAGPAQGVWQAVSEGVLADTSGAGRFNEDEQAASPGWRQCLFWVALAAAPSILLLALTRELTTNVAPVPFLWVLPLSIYLLSFVVCFDAARYYVRRLFLSAFPIALGAIAFSGHLSIGIAGQVALVCSSLFVFCMVCHGELARKRPAVRHLTLFYLMLSLGGALGGTFVALLAPVMFRSYLELPIGLILCASLVTVVCWGEASRFARPILGLLLIGYAAWLAADAARLNRDARLVRRNFYSQTSVADRPGGQAGPVRALFHGVIIHGEQLLDPATAQTPISYFCRQSGIGRMIDSLPQTKPRSLGVLGLGAGTLAAYGRAQDTLRFYEINEQVLDIARDEFSFLKASAAKVVTVLGDGRLSLEEEFRKSGSNQFDLLAIDAFSGDSIPVHLVTREALKGYLMHLKPDGVLALNITNRYVDLRPVLAAAAKSLKRVALLIEHNPDSEKSACLQSIWVFLVTPQIARSLPAEFQDAVVLKSESKSSLWTDDFSNLLGVLN
jgi:spermidine synthase